MMPVGSDMGRHRGRAPRFNPGWLARVFMALAVWGLMGIGVAWCSSGLARLVVDPNFVSQGVSRYLEFFVDDSLGLNLGDIIQEGFGQKFAPLKGRTSFGYSKSAFWFHMEAENPGAVPITWDLEYTYAVVDQIEIYVPSRSGYQTFRGGDRFPFSVRPVPFRTMVVPVTLEPGIHNLYLRVLSGGTISIPVRAWSEAAFENHRAWDAAVNWMYYGLMAATIIYALFFMVSVRQSLLAHLVMFIGATAMFTMTHTGLAFQYLWPDSPGWANAAHPFLGIVAAISLLLFTQPFLETRDTCPRYHALLKVLAGIGGFLLAAPFILPYRVATQSMVVFCVVSVLAMGCTGTALLVRGSRPARFYMLALSSLLISILLMGLKAYGLLASNTLIDSGVQISAALMVVLFSFGIIDAIATIRFELEHALRQVRKSERQYRFLADNVKDVIWTMDLKSLQLNYITPSIKAMLGFTPEEATGFTFDAMLPPESRTIAWDYVKHGLSEDFSEFPRAGMPRTLDLQCYDRHRNPVWTETTITILHDVRKRPRELLGVTRDITERKQAEQEKKALESQLIQAGKLEAIGTLAGGIAHDMNNIITAIRGYIDISLSEVPEDSRIHHRLSRVVQACNRAGGLVRQILTFCRQDIQEAKPLDINPILIEVLALIRASIPTTIKINQDIPKARHVILGDPTQIHQIVMNLCSNARDAMLETGGTLYITTETMNLDTDTAKRYLDLMPGPYVRLTVSDTGHGMDAPTRSRIFEPFFTTKPKGQGTGMGLAMVHGIVSKLGGAIYVYSEPGQGTTFNLFFPKVPESDLDDSVREEPVVLGSETILFVDDEPIVLDVAAEMLTDLGYTVLTFPDSSLAYDQFLQEPDRFDLVISDQTMAGMTGVGLAEKIHALRPDKPVVLCTGFIGHITPGALSSAGVKSLLLKPFSKEDLARKIRAALDRPES
ncbi:MAG: 7TM diverse intracellular signaling domain-containing protein [Pseudomonadota bacterium]